MKGTITKIFHNERSSKFTVEGADYICNAKTRRELSVGDVVEFDKGDFNGKATANNLKKVGREEPKAQDPTSAPAGAASTAGTGSGSLAASPAADRKPWSKGKDDPDTAARIARSVALSESIKVTSMLLEAKALPLPKDEKKHTDVILAFMQERRDEFYNYIAGVKDAAPADGAPKTAGGVADLGQE